MKYVMGEILTPEGFIKGYVDSERQDEYFEIQRGTPVGKPLAKGLIVPSFVNAHIHIGDSFIREKHLELPRKVRDLVAPPDGLKYRLLKEASEEEILDGIHASLAEMDAAGTSWFCDFREGGLIGIFQLRKAMRDSHVDSVILSRPSHMTYDKEELDMLLQSSDGIGLSSISDWELTEIGKIASHVRKKKKIFALHGSEATREDIDILLDLHPNFLVHMITASQADLERVKDADIPIVICPRSYQFFQLKTNFDVMKKTGVTMLVGTDNAMMNSPDVGEDVRLLRHTGLFSNEELLTNVTYSPRKALNLDDYIQGGNLLKHFIVLEKESLKPIYVSQ
jgi:cytosine/adenosine deaminase-related metal-dependent hydrolase